jgi:hypothetical protein
MIRRLTEDRTRDDHTVEGKETQKDKLKEEQRNRGTEKQRNRRRKEQRNRGTIRKGFFFAVWANVSPASGRSLQTILKFMYSQKDLAKPNIN